MSYKAIYAYAWDLAETGVVAAADEFRALGLDTVTMAASYHAGKFMRPHGRAGKVYFPDDGTVYFRADPSRYGAIKPVRQRAARRTRHAARTASMRAAWRSTPGWCCCTIRGSAWPTRTPSCATPSAIPTIYNLCPSAPQARAYAVGLVRDVTEKYAVRGMSLETPGFAPYAHGYHHEFALVKSNAWLENRLGLCFCSHCMAGAEKAGIDARA